MKKSEIERRLAAIITNYTEFDMKTVNQSTTLREDIGLTSFDTISLITEIEESFSVNIDDAAILSEIVTFGETVDFIAYVLEAA